MNNSRVSFKLKEWVNRVDWRLLLFLLLFMNVKLAVKIAAILLIYILRPDFRFGVRFKQSRIPLFYFLVILIGVVSWLLNGLAGNSHYDVVMVTGIFFWLLCVLAFHQVRIAVERNRPAIIHNSIFVFLMINVACSLLVYAWIMYDAGSMNPYRYQGQFQKYFMGTGDYIKGITMDTSTTNAVINTFGVVYFLLRNKYLPLLLCMTVLLLTGSNVSNLLLTGVFVFLFLFKSNRSQKSMIVVCITMLVAFLAGISPQNNDYVEDSWKKMFSRGQVVAVTPIKIIPLSQRSDSSLSTTEKKQKIAQQYIDSVYVAVHEKDLRSLQATSLSTSTALIGRPIVVKDDIHSPGFQHRNDTTVAEEKLIEFVKEKKSELPIAGTKIQKPSLPGKLLAFKQTIVFFKQHPALLVTGAGMGNFSSKLAFRATAMKIAGGYPTRFAYISDAFKTNHFDLYLYYFTGKDDWHSITNSPNSTYDQLLGEYGMLGIAAFICYYIGFFSRQVKKLTYGIPVLLLMLGCFIFDYWFEQLSVVILFELLLLLNIKETKADAAT